MATLVSMEGWIVCATVLVALLYITTIIAMVALRVRFDDKVLALPDGTAAGLTSRHVHLPKPVVVLVNQVIHENYVAVRRQLKAYVLDTRYEKAFESDVNLRVMHAFAEHRIGPPAILHRTVPGGGFLDPLQP